MSHPFLASFRRILARRRMIPVWGLTALSLLAMVGCVLPYAIEIRKVEQVSEPSPSSGPASASAPSSASRAVAVVSAQVGGGHKLALVFGNAQYSASPLKNAVHDAGDMAAKLRSLGFTVLHRENSNRREMTETIREFGKGLKKGGVGLFYYAGHGLQVGGVNYLVPIDARIEKEADVEFECVNAQRVLAEMYEAGNGLNVVILDACRDNPYARGWRSSNPGLAKMDAPTGTFIVFATAPGSAAADGTGRNGVFTGHLLKYIGTPGLEVEDVIKRVRVAVAKETGSQQVPWSASSLMGDFYFVPGPAVVASPAPAPPNSSIATPAQIAPSAGPTVTFQSAEPPAPSSPGSVPNLDGVIQDRMKAEKKWGEWQKKMASEFARAKQYDGHGQLKPQEKISAWEAFLNVFQNDNPFSTQDDDLRRQATDRWTFWTQQPAPSSPSTALVPGSGSVSPSSGSSPEPAPKPARKVNSIGQAFILVSAGTFTMGALSVTGTVAWEGPRHLVTISNPFYLQETEVTQRQWTQVMGSNPSENTRCGPGCPVEFVSWNDVQTFIQRLNQLEGTTAYVLPSEAQWEYAAWAGKDGRNAGQGTIRNLDPYAWYSGNSGEDISRVAYFDGTQSHVTLRNTALKKPNAWGFYDMSGNVHEWVRDWAGPYPTGSVIDPRGPAVGQNREARGGAYDSSPEMCRPSARKDFPPGYKSFNLGFRLAQTQ